MSYLSSSHCNIVPPTQEDKLRRAYWRLRHDYDELERFSMLDGVLKKIASDEVSRRKRQPEPNVFSFLLGMFTPKATSNQPPLPPCTK